MPFYLYVCMHICNMYTHTFLCVFKLYIVVLYVFLQLAFLVQIIFKVYTTCFYSKSYLRFIWIYVDQVHSFYLLCIVPLYKEAIV